MNSPKKWPASRCLFAFNWLPFFSLFAVLALLITANIAIFDARGMAGLNDLHALSQLWINQTAKTGFDPEQARLVASLRDASARLNWMIAGSFQTLALFLALAYFIKVIRQTLPCEHSWRVIGGICVFLILAALVQAKLDANGLALDQLTGSGLAYTKMLLTMAGVPNHTQLVIDFENALALVVTLFGTLAACATIANPGPDSVHSVASLKARIRQLRNLLTASAIAMVICAIQVSAEYRWPASLLREKIHSMNQPDKYTLPLAETVTNYASSVTLTFGGVFTLFMIAIFGTAFLVLDKKAARLAADRDRDLYLSQDEWRVRNGISFSFVDIYTDIGKIIGPLVVAVVGSFITF